jgi:hypothetical protein
MLVASFGLATLLFAQAVFTPIPFPTAFNGSRSSRNWYATFAVTDIGKPGVPALTPRERRWLKMIASVPAYGKRWAFLRFATARGYARPPLVVFDAGDWFPEYRGIIGFHIIGEPCNTWFDPRADALRPTTEAACTNPPPDILGEDQFLHLR